MGRLDLAITPARIEEAQHFVELALMSGRGFLEVLFEDQSRKILEALYIEKGNLFSHECCMFAKFGNHIAGMVLAYPYEYSAKFRLRTGFLLIKEMGISSVPRLLSVDRVIGKHGKNEFYISNLAVYPDFRNKGLARGLLQYCFEAAKRAFSTKVTLDVEEENEVAIKLYTKMGFQFERKSTIKLGKNIFHFVRMSKPI